MTHVDGGGVPVGTQLNGIYEIEKRIAMGGMGEVYVGKLIQTGDRVAIKMILPEHANNEIILDLFRKEASTLHNLYHEAIVRYYVFSVDPVLNRPYLAMEFAGGPALGDRLVDGGPLNQPEMAVLCRRVAGGLHAAHKLGIIHRDISPDNVILVDGDVERAKIIDFGIAKSTSSEGTLIGSGFAGKLNYVSPEQLGLEGGDVTGKSDIYSLGLVFAEAVIGRPLPMGGSQVEVIEKRRTVPDLSAVPEWIRPLIEAMIQPDPANRPADMEAVANWELGTSTGSSETPAVADAQKAVHPRDRRRQQQQEREKDNRNGLPWLGIGLGGAGLAAAAAAAYVFVINPDILGGGTENERPSVTVVRPSAVAPSATAGQVYRWSSNPFKFDQSDGDLQVSADGTLPDGLSLQAGTDGSVVILGTPDAGGDYSFAINASMPDGSSASQTVTLTVEDFAIALVTPPTSGGTTLTAPTGGGDSSLTSPGGASGSGVSLGTQAPGGLSIGDGSTGALGTPTAPTSTTPNTGKPISGGGLTAPSGGGLTAPTGGGDSGSLSAPTGSDGKPNVGTSVAVATGGGQTSPTKPLTPPPDNTPGAGSTDPSVPTNSPGGLLSPSGGGGAAPTAGGSDGGSLTIPPTGGGALQSPTGGGTELANIPTSGNQPPTIQDAAQGSLSVVQGQDVNVRLGAFFDEEGGSSLKLNVDGSVPAGVAVRIASKGVVQLYGRPAEFGEFDIRVAAVDAQGLVSKPIPVRISISPPVENRAVRDYILGYNGGQCFLSRPLDLGPNLAQIEVFAAEIPPVIAFDGDFKRDQGFEANIGLRLISGDQCPLVNALDQVGPQALDNSLQINLVKDELAAGDRLQGSLQGGEGARLFLFDHLGGMTNLTDFLKPGAGGATFGLPIHADGPQILIAAKPRADSGLTASAGLEELLGAAQRGQASLALAFFVIKGS